MEARGNVWISLSKYWFQTRAVPRLEPTHDKCDELAITFYVSVESAKEIN